MPNPQAPTLTRYAFCYVAIYGQSFSEAGRSVFSLFERHGIATLLNDSTTDLILTMAVFIGGAFGVLATGVIGIAVYGTSSGALFFAMAGGAFVSCAPPLCHVDHPHPPCPLQPRPTPLHR